MKTRKITSLNRWKSTHPESPGDLTNFAKLWFDLSPYNQLIYCQGMKDGFIQGCLDANVTFIQTHEELTPANEDLEAKAISTAGLNIVALANRVTRMYRKPQNRIFPFHIICAAVMNLLEGVPAKEVERDLIKLKRSIMESPGPGQ